MAQGFATLIDCQGNPMYYALVQPTEPAQPVVRRQVGDVNSDDKVAAMREIPHRPLIINRLLNWEAESPVDLIGIEPTTSSM